MSTFIYSLLYIKYYNQLDSRTDLSPMCCIGIYGRYADALPSVPPIAECLGSEVSPVQSVCTPCQTQACVRNSVEFKLSCAVRELAYPEGARVICRMRILECGKLSRGNLRKVKCETFRKLPLVAFPHSAGEKFRISISADRRKTTVHSHCTTDVQPIHRSVRRPALPSFCILCGLFATEQGSFF